MDGDQQNEILFGFPFMVLVGLIVAFGLDALFTGDWKTWSDSTERKIGFTFTGWLLGAIVFLAFYGKKTTFGPLFLLNLFLPIFAFAQSVGRIGCFLGGCCYGTPCSYGVRYPPGSFPYSVVGDIPLFPIQLIESLALLILFVVCIRSSFRLRATIYLFGIAIIRFVIEFFRYDHRGNFFGFTGLSPQQCMSLIFLAIAMALFVHVLNARRMCINKTTALARKEI